MKPAVEHHVTYTVAGYMAKEWWTTKDDSLQDVEHRDGGPALIIYHGGEPHCEFWYQHGELCNPSGEPSIRYYRAWHHTRKTNCELKHLEWHKDGKRYRLDTFSGLKGEEVLVSTQYIDDDGIYHKLDGPALIEYENGILYTEEWFKEGEAHCLDGPAFTEYFENGQAHVEIWAKNNKRHCTNGPAYREYDTDGNMTHSRWFINHEEVDVSVILSILTEIEPADAVEIKLLYG